MPQTYFEGLAVFFSRDKVFFLSKNDFVVSSQRRTPEMSANAHYR